MDQFTEGYITAALWSSTDNSDPDTGGDPLEDNYEKEDIAPETMAEMIADCTDFQESNADDLAEAERLEPSQDAFRSGVYFWLTRNHHGAGFWDRGLGDIGDRLTKNSHPYGDVDLYVGDDGRIYA